MLSLDKAFRSKVARRVFLLFVLCAMVPLVGIATISLLQVRKQITAQNNQHLYESTKGKALAIFERLSFVDRELSLFATELNISTNGYHAANLRADERYRAIAVVREGEVLDELHGELSLAPELSSTQLERLGNGESVLIAGAEGGPIWMVRPMEREALLVAEIAAGYLWALDDLPSQHELAVFDAAGAALFSSALPPPRSERHLQFGQRLVRWERAGEVYFASSWELPLKFAFGSPPWFVMLSATEASRLAPVTEFMRAFPLVMLLSFWVVLLLSVTQIKRSLDPLERLKEGTDQIGQHDFSTRVDITSGDEFEDVARSFNLMSARLGRQFHTLTALSEIDRAVLSTLKTEEIAEQLLSRLFGILSAESARITVLDSPPVAFTGRRAASHVERSAVKLEPEASELRDLLNHPEGFRVGPGHASPLVTNELVSVLLPIVLEGRPAAVLSVGYKSEQDLSDEERRQARQLADRFAVALANAELVKELDRLNWGSLVALARTIDAKSPWTAGHSERAALLGVAIGETLGLDKCALDIVHRGGLLHDIGKIGVPPEILDKTGKLTDEERDVMKEHPGIGARILEPIEAYQKYIPVVLQHHEWFDGSGYPGGLAGDDISLHARVYAVADVYDALFADRPYRQGLVQGDVVEYIESRSGSQFDPVAVRAFLALVEEGDPRLKDRSRHVHRLTGAFASSPAALKKG